MALTITIPGAVETTTGSTAPAVLTVGVGSPGVGVPSGGTAGQVLTKVDSTDYNTVFATPSADFITSVTAPLAVATGVLSVDLSTLLPKAGGIITGNIQANNGSGYRSFDNVYSQVNVSAANIQLLNAGPGGNTLTVEWDGITFADGKQTVKFPGAATLFANAALTGNPTAPTPAINDNDTSIATTAFVIGQAGTGTPIVDGTAAVGTSLLYSRQDHVHPSADFITSVTAPLAVGSGVLSVDLSTYLTTSAAASTYYLQTNPDDYQTGTQVNNTLGSYLTSYQAGLTYFTIANAANKADLASPTFTGTPTLPTGTIGVTQTAGNSTTALATTAFVTTADNLKANLASPTFTGTPAAPTATAGTNTTQLATTEFVRTDNNVKAWVNFNGTGTVSIRTSFNVTSVTDNGVGTYTVNLTNAISSNAIGVAMVSDDSTAYRGINLQGGIANITTTSYKLNSFRTSGTQEDCSVVQLAIFR